MVKLKVGYGDVPFRATNWRIRPGQRRTAVPFCKIQCISCVKWAVTRVFAVKFWGFESGCDRQKLQKYIYIYVVLPQRTYFHGFLIWGNYFCPASFSHVYFGHSNSSSFSRKSFGLGVPRLCLQDHMYMYWEYSGASCCGLCHCTSCTCALAKKPSNLASFYLKLASTFLPPTGW